MFTEIDFHHVCFSVSLLKIFRTAAPQNIYKQLFLNEFQVFQFHFKEFNHMPIPTVNCKSEKKFQTSEFEKMCLLALYHEEETKMENLLSCPTFLGK